MAFAETVWIRIKGGLVGLVVRLKHRQTRTTAKPIPSLNPNPKPPPPVRTPTRPEGMIAQTDASRTAQEEVTSEGLVCVANTEGVEAIVDTGASRCVMGDALLAKFLQPLGAHVRAQVRTTPSSVKFRFGNNQTLTSPRRVLLPLPTPSGPPLW